MAKVLTLSGSTTVGNSGNTTIAELVCNGQIENITFQVYNTSGVSLDALVVEIKASSTADYVTLVSSYGSTTDTLWYYSGNLAALATATSATAQVRVGRPYSVRISGSLASSSGTVAVSGIAAGA